MGKGVFVIAVIIFFEPSLALTFVGNVIKQSSADISIFIRGQNNLLHLHPLWWRDPDIRLICDLLLGTADVPRQKECACSYITCMAKPKIQ